MRQIFDLSIATEALGRTAQQLGVTVETLQRIKISVTAQIIQQPAPYLQLTYEIHVPQPSLTDQLNWPTWRAKQVGFIDYLWEETCLECFITGQSTSDNDIADIKGSAPYIEINASPDGRYALYQFNSYRRPATLPPSPVLLADKQTYAFIEWHNDPTPNKPSQPPASEHHTRRFCVPLTQQQTVNSNAVPQYYLYGTAIRRIHPCVILWFGTTALYFAPQHASPPDFHDQRYWSTAVL